MRLPDSRKIEEKKRLIARLIKFWFYTLNLSLNLFKRETRKFFQHIHAHISPRILSLLFF